MPDLIGARSSFSRSQSFSPTASLEFKGRICLEGEIKNQHNNNSSILCLLITSQGKLFSGGSDNIICAYNFNWDKREFYYDNTLSGHRNSINNLCEMPNYNFILSCSDDKTIKMWNINNYQCVKTYEGHNSDVNCVLALEDGRVISASTDKTIKVWNEKGECKNTLTGHSDPVRSLILSNDKRIISCSSDKSVRFWDLNTLKCQNEHTIKDVPCSGNTNCTLYMPNEDKLFVGGQGVIKIIDLKQYKVIGTINEGLNGKGIHSIVKLIDGSFVVCLNSNSDNIIKFDKNFKFETKVQYPQRNYTRYLIPLPNINRFVNSDNRGHIFIWEY